MNDSPYTAPRYQGTEQPELAPEHTTAVRGLQIITMALIAGSCIFTGFALSASNGALGTQPNVLSWIAIGFAGIQFMLHLVMPGVIRRNQIKKIDIGAFDKRLQTDQLMDLLNVLRGPHIVACALLEGAVFFNLVIYMVTRFVGNLGAAIFLIFGLAVRFPTRDRVMSWLSELRRELETQ